LSEVTLLALALLVAALGVAGVGRKR
jgi:hypothetical protein